MEGCLLRDGKQQSLGSLPVGASYLAGRTSSVRTAQQSRPRHLLSHSLTAVSSSQITLAVLHLRRDYLATSTLLPPHNRTVQLSILLSVDTLCTSILSKPSAVGNATRQSWNDDDSLVTAQI